jgi:FtsP/CotA-like multicopper oxidase with cupredoxin domain
VDYDCQASRFVDKATRPAPLIRPFVESAIPLSRAGLTMPFSRRRFLGSAVAISLFDLPARAAEPPPGPDGFRVLEARPGLLRLVPEPAHETAVWGYNGETPGPLLRYKKGEEVKVRLVNKLDQPTSLSWPGVRIANPMDGVAGLTQKPVLPSEFFDYRFTPPDSGFFWYRPQVAPFVSEQLGRGLYGVLIVDEIHPPQTDKDMLAIIADWRLDDKAQISGDFGSDAAPGALITLNSQSVPAPETLPPGSRVRLRILSAVNARFMLISFQGIKPMILAVDGQPGDTAFEPVRSTIPVGPGGRFDVMFDLPVEPRAEASLILRGDDEPDRVLLAFKTEGEPRAPLPPIASLELNPLLPKAIKLQAAKRVDIVIEAAKPKETPVSSAPTPATSWTLNGVAADGFSQKPLFSVKRDSPVTLAIVNRTAFIQQIDIHGHHMRLLHDLDDGWEPYWRDSVLVPAGKTKHVAFLADNPGKWAIESVRVGSQAAALVTWFEVG